MSEFKNKETYVLIKEEINQELNLCVAISNFWRDF